MSQLTRLALGTLQHADSTPGLRAVACATLLHAFEASVQTPAGAHMAVWRYLLTTDGSATTLHRHEIPNPEVARDAVRVLLEADSGEAGHDLALAVLRGPNVAEVTSEALFSIADRVMDEGRVRRVSWLVERCHEEGRGLSPEFVVALRDRLAGSRLPTVRAAAAEVGALLAHLDEEFVLKMLADDCPMVRMSAIDQLEKFDQVDRARAEAIVRQHLAAEHHRSVVSSCHYALASLVQTRGRHVQLPQPATDTEH